MVGPSLVAGQRALAAGEWDAARAEFETALETAPSPEAFDGLAVTLWWSGRTSDSLQVRARAYAGFRAHGQLEEAARAAVWLAGEYRDLYANHAVADGWLARAESCLVDADESAARGWLLLARAQASSSATDAAEQARGAASIGRRVGDADLEVVALARLGVVEIAMGDVDAGCAHIDEALAAATGGESEDPRTFGEACCALMQAADLLGDAERVATWGTVVTDYLAVHDYPPLQAYGSPSRSGALSAFCGACCGGIYLVTGRIDEAEAELLRAIATLQASGMSSRCIHPITQLADLRIVQGRLEEARLLLDDHEHLPESVRPLAALDLARGAPDVALARLQARIEQLTEQPVTTFPLRALLVDAHVALGDEADAEAASASLEHIWTLTGSRRHEAELLFARGKIAAHRGLPEAADLLRAASQRFSEASLPLPASRARLARARFLVSESLGVAITEARAALSAFERMGATVDADGAAAFLRQLGVKGRTGPREVGRLSQREAEVLRLVARGLSNQEIAERLFISVKTAGHHVSSILSKLGLRSRTEAAAFAVLNPDQERVGR